MEDKDDKDKKVAPSHKGFIISAIVIIAVFVIAAVVYPRLKASESPEITLSPINSTVPIKAETEKTVTDNKADSQQTEQPVIDTQAQQAASVDTQASNSQASNSQASNSQASNSQASNSQASNSQASNTQASNTQASDTQAETASQKFPDFPITRLDGTTGNFSDELEPGLITVINSFASWCPPCKMELPDFIQASKDYKGKVKFLFFDNMDGTRETKQTITDFAAKTFPSDAHIYLDPGYVNYIVNSNSLPTTVFLDKDGNYLGKSVGAMSKESLYSILDKLLPN
ncbi:MAG: redoxin domain-containing protein [Spirochaetia bacterium]|jgi:thiol-disulfide isomerase/thioredoxin|nr:redoxin domain-containing protein [Spirochaetia bacterium]